MKECNKPRFFKPVIFLVVFVSTTLITSVAVAQNDLRSGYVLTLQQDTLRGWIDFDAVAIRRGEVQFYNTPDVPAQDLHTEAISGFGLVDEDRYFESTELAVDGKNLRKVFAEMLFRGRANLYTFDGSFYISKDSRSEKIEQQQQREAQQNGGRYVYEHKTYIGTLNRYFSDCLPDKLYRGEVAFSERSFVDIFKRYSECSGTAYYQYKQSPQRRKVQFYVLAGYHSSSIKFSQRDVNVFDDDDNFFVGAGVAIPLQFIADNISLTAEPTYHRNQFSGLRDGYTSTGTVKKDYIIDLSTIKIPVGIKVPLSRKSFAPYLRAGMTALFPLNHNWKIQYQGVTEHEFNIEVNRLPLTYWGAIGFEKKISSKHAAYLEFRMEKIKNPLNFYGPEGATGITSSVSNKMVIFGFYF